MSTPEIAGGVFPPVELQENQQLREVELSFINAARILLDGPATKPQRERMFELEEPYREALNIAGLIAIQPEEGENIDETQARENLIDVVTTSLHTVISNAAYEHYQSSVVEKARHFLESGKIRRKLGGLAIGAAASGATAGAFKLVELIPGVERSLSVGIGAGVAGLVLRRFKPEDLVKKAIEAPSDKFKKQAERGIEKHDPKIVQEVMQTVKREMANTQNKEASKRRSYELITEKSYMVVVASNLWTELGPDKLETPEQQRYIVSKAVDISVDWLMAFYGLQRKTEGTEAKPIVLFREQKSFPWMEPGKSPSLVENQSK